MVKQLGRLRGLYGNLVLIAAAIGDAAGTRLLQAPAQRDAVVHRRAAVRKAGMMSGDAIREQRQVYVVRHQQGARCGVVHLGSVAQDVVLERLGILADVMRHPGGICPLRRAERLGKGRGHLSNLAQVVAHGLSSAILARVGHSGQGVGKRACPHFRRAHAQSFRRCLLPDAAFIRAYMLARSADIPRLLLGHRQRSYPTMPWPKPHIRPSCWPRSTGRNVISGVISEAPTAITTVLIPGLLVYDANGWGTAFAMPLWARASCNAFRASYKGLFLYDFARRFQQDSR